MKFVITYWLKDDHRYNDSDDTGKILYRHQSP